MSEREKGGERPRLSRRFRRGFAIALVATAAAWSIGSFWLLPRLLRAAYEGARIPLLTRALGGRASTPIETYLEQGRALAATLGIALGIAFLLGLSVWAFRSELRRAWFRIVRRGGARSGGRLALSAGFLGLALGCVEALAAWVRFRSTGYISTYNDPDLLWMVPLGQGAAFLVSSWILFHALRGPSRGVRPSFILGLHATFGVTGILLGLSPGLAPFYLGIHWSAVLLLALGVGSRIGMAIGSRPGLLGLASRAAVPAFLGLALAPLLASGLERWREAERSRSAPAVADGRNVVFIVWDTVRSQNLHLYGYARPNTPHLERLAAEGVVFDMAIASSPWTLPTHGSFFTGRLPYELSADFEAPLDGRFPTLAEFFRDRGYRTGGFVANFDYTAPGSGLTRGFLHYEAHARSLGTLLSASTVVRRAIGFLWRGRRLLSRKRAPEVTSSFLSWLDRDRERPVFAFLNYWDAHAPYELYPEHLHGPTPVPPGVERATLGPLRDRIDAYDSSIGLMDATLGTLLRGLRDRGALENTIVILVSDHGEHFGEQDLTSHANSLYAPLLRVPLVIRAPGLPAGERVSAPVSVRDLAATAVDLAGFESSGFPGRSLASVPRSAAREPSEPVLAELSGLNGLRRPPGEPVEDGPMKSAILEGLQLIRNGDGEEELYDWIADPASIENLIDAPRDPDILQRLREYVRFVQARDTLCGFRYAERTGDGACH